MGKSWAGEGEPAPLHRGRVESTCGESGSGEEGGRCWSKKSQPTLALLPRGTLGCCVRGKGRKGAKPTGPWALSFTYIDSFNPAMQMRS